MPPTYTAKYSSRSTEHSQKYPPVGTGKGIFGVARFGVTRFGKAGHTYTAKYSRRSTSYSSKYT